MNFLEFLKTYKWRIIAVAIAVVFMVLIFTIGFWRTLLLALLVAVAYFIGTLLDEGGRENFIGFIKTLFGGKNN